MHCATQPAWSQPPLTAHRVVEFAHACCLHNAGRARPLHSQPLLQILFLNHHPPRTGPACTRARAARAMLVMDKSGTFTFTQSYVIIDHHSPITGSSLPMRAACVMSVVKRSSALSSLCCRHKHVCSEISTQSKYTCCSHRSRALTSAGWPCCNCNCTAPRQVCTWTQCARCSKSLCLLIGLSRALLSRLANSATQPSCPLKCPGH